MKFDVKRWLRRAHPLRTRVAALEELLQNPDRFAELLKSAAARTVDGRVSGNYFNARFRDYEWAILSVKTLGHHFAMALADKLPAPPQSAPFAVGLTSRLCLQSDIESDWIGFWCREIGSPRVYHRKVWELCYVPQALHEGGVLRPGAAGLGFGCGEEPLPSLFAKYGASVLATDQEPVQAARAGWVQSQEHASSVEKLRIPGICPDPDKLAKITLRYLDMNAIPADLHGKFDFCWSVCALEHLGTIENGLRFIQESMKTLKPGGTAVHTLEYNLADDAETIEKGPTVLYQKKHLRDVADRLTRSGYAVSPLDFAVGEGVLDRFVDVPPWSNDAVPLMAQRATLRLAVDGFPCTSFGIIVRAP